VTVGSVQAGSKHNIISDTATLMVNVRTYDPSVRERVLASISRVVDHEAAAAGAPRSPEVELIESAPTLVNDEASTVRVGGILRRVFGEAKVFDPGPLPSSEDVQVLSTAAGAPLVYWLLGGADQQLFDDVKSVESILEVVGTLASNHSPTYLPASQPTIDNGVAALVAVARSWLGDETSPVSSD
jgi:hippurate hydrolase